MKPNPTWEMVHRERAEVRRVKRERAEARAEVRRLRRERKADVPTLERIQREVCFAFCSADGLMHDDSCVDLRAIVERLTPRAETKGNAKRRARKEVPSKAMTLLRTPDPFVEGILRRDDEKWRKR